MFNLKLALRALFRTPFVTAVAILSLGLGIGANAAIFSLFNQMLLAPLPVPDAHRLVNLTAPGPKSGMTSCGGAGDCDSIFSYPMFRDLEKQQTSFTGIAAHRNFGVNLAYKGQTLSGGGLLVSGSYFQVLGLVPAHGRLLQPADDGPIGSPSAVVLSHRYWQSRFESNPAVVGETLIINGQPMTIIGVGPEGFDGTTIGSRPQVFVPMTMSDALQPNRRLLENRRGYWIYLFARLKPGVSMEEAAAAINQPYAALIQDVEVPLQAGMSEPTLERFKAKRIGIESGVRGQSRAPGEARVPLLLLLGVTFVVLLSACANIANLLLTKAVGRLGEMAVRLSIGASRRQLVSQLLGESVLLALFGGAFGLFVGQATLSVLGAILPPEAASSLIFELDGRVIGFLATVTVGTGLLFGLFPALHSTRPNLAVTLKGQAGQPGGARAAKRFRVTLATTQVVLSMALLAIAGLFTKSLINVTRVELGVRMEGIFAFSVSPETNGYAPERSKQLFEQIEDTLAATPGVTKVTAGMVPLLAGNSWGTNVSVEGFEAGPDADTHSNLNAVAPGYFDTLDIPLLAGREFTRADTLGAPKVAVVNEAFVRKFNLSANPVGRRMAVGRGALDIEIVGFARDAKYAEVKDAVPAQFFTPYRQDERSGSLTFYVTTAGPPESVMAAIVPLLARIDGTLPVEDLRTLRQQAADNVFLDRIISTLAAAFAALATILAAVGLYGVLAYTVAQRTREIGLRMALGADAARIRRMVLRQVAWITAVGIAIGLSLAAAAGWSAQSQLFEMTGFDPLVLTVSAATLALIAFGAGIIPAWRASRVDPMLALRYE